MSSAMPQDLPGAADRLYGLDPAAFTGARNELAAAARRAGNDDLARQIAALRKPSTAAWAVNLLLRRRRADLQRLFALADLLRDGGTDQHGNGPREVNQKAARLVTAIVRLATDLAAEQGHRLSPALTDQVRGTLRAAMADRSAAAAVLSGHLVTALESSQLAGLGDGDGDGLDISHAVGVPLAVTSLAGHVPRRAAARDPAGALAAARAASTDADRRADEADRESEDSERHLSALHDERERATAAVQRTRRALREQEERLVSIREQLTEAERSHRRLRRQAEAARRDADRAAQRFRALSDPPEG